MPIIQYPGIQKDVFGGPGNSTRNAMWGLSDALVKYKQIQNEKQQAQVISDLFAGVGGDEIEPGTGNRSRELTADELVQQIMADNRLDNRHKMMATELVAKRQAMQPKPEGTLELTAWTPEGKRIPMRVPESKYNAYVSQLEGMGYTFAKQEENDKMQSGVGKLIADRNRLANADPESPYLKEIDEQIRNYGENKGTEPAPPEIVKLLDQQKKYAPGSREWLAIQGVIDKRSGAVQTDPDDYSIPVQTSSGVYSFNTRTREYAPLADEEGKPLMPISADTELAGRKKTAEKTAEAEVAKKYDFPKARNRFNSLNRQWDNVNGFIDKALDQVNMFTAGPGSWASGVPGTPMRDLRETLETIKANIGFDKLDEMRANSPTGGALGQVSEFENKLLQAVRGSLDQGQSPEQLRENLKNVKQLLNDLRTETRIAYRLDYKDYINKESGENPGDRAKSRADELIEKYGGK